MFVSSESQLLIYNKQPLKQRQNCIQGSHILSTLLNEPSTSLVTTYSRRAPKNISDKLSPVVSEDMNEWRQKLASSSPPPEIFFSAFGSTRASAGGLDKQYALEHGAHLDVVRAAKEAGSKVCVLISSGKASAKSRFPYMRMKGEIEDEIIAMKFEKTVILRPGLILGRREESRFMESMLQLLVSGLGKVGATGIQNHLAQRAEVIARAAVNAGMKAAKGEGEGAEGLRFVTGSEIVEVAESQ